MNLNQLINLHEETKNSFVKKKQLSRDTKNSMIPIFNKRVYLELHKIKLINRKILKYVKEKRILKNSSKKKMEVTESFDSKIKFDLFSKQFIFYQKVYQRKKNNSYFNQVCDKNIFEFGIKFFLKKFVLKILSSSNLSSFFKILNITSREKISQRKTVCNNLEKFLITTDFSEINPFFWHFLKEVITIYYLKLLKKINHSYKIIVYFKDLILKICYFQKKTKHLNSNFLTDGFLNEKETKLGSLLLKRFSLNNLSEFQKQIFSYKKFEIFLISEKNNDIKTFFKKNFSIKRVEMSFLFPGSHKMLKNKIFFSKNLRNSTLNLILLPHQLDFSLSGKNYEKKTQFFFSKILFKITSLLIGKFLSFSKVDQVKILLYNIINLFGVCNNKQKKYFLIFFCRLKEHMYRFFLKLEAQSTKILLDSSNKLNEKISLDKELNSEKSLICCLCSKRNYLNDLKPILKITENIFAQVLLFKFIFRIFTHFKLYHEMFPSIRFFSILKNTKCLFEDNLGISVSKKFHLFFRKVVEKKFNQYLNDQFIIIKFFRKLEKFQDRFLFYIFLVIQRIYLKLVISKKEIKDIRIYEKKMEPKINFDLFHFLRNILLDFYFGEILKKKKLMVNYKKSGTELLLIIGPNRDIFKFQKRFHNELRDKIIKKNFKIWHSKLIDLNHFSRISKTFILKQLLFDQKKKRQYITSKIKFKLFNLSILKTKDPKLIKLFIIFHYEQKNRFFFDDSIYKHLLSKKICQDFESFYESLAYYTKTFKNCFRNLSKKKKSSAKIRKLNFDHFDDCFLGNKTINLREVFLTKEMRDLLKTFQITRNFKDIQVIFLLDYIITISTKNNFDGDLFKFLCFVIMFHSFFIISKDKWGFQDSLINVLNIFEKSIKKNFLILRKDTSLVIKDCRMKFFNLHLLNKIKCVFKKERGAFKHKRKQEVIRNIFSQEILIHDFSEHFLLNSKNSLKKAIKYDFC